MNPVVYTPIISGTRALARAELSPEMKEYRRQERSLEESCKQFESVLVAMIWKDMTKSAKSFGGDKEKHLYGALEDTAMEMAAEAVTSGEGVGLWKVLYAQLHQQLKNPEASDPGSTRSLR